MPKLHDYRADFRRGRTGHGLRANQKAGAYTASVFDARNMMVMADGSLQRRWGTHIRKTLTAGARLESWTYASSDQLKFLLVFEPAKLTIYDMELTEKAAFTGCPWDATTMWTMSMAVVNYRMFIADAAFRTQLLRLNNTAVTFSLVDFTFLEGGRDGRFKAPFFEFASATNTATFTIFTSAGEQAAYGAHIATALSINPADFDLSAGTGKVSLSADHFVADHVDTMMRIGDGEFEITAVTDARNATVRIVRDISTRLDTDPIFLRNGSAVAEVAAEDHGLQVGDTVFLYGLATAATDYAKNVLTNAVPYGGGAPISGTAATYTVTRVPDSNHFEIVGGANLSGTTGLYGGSDVYMIPGDGMTGLAEPAMSDAQGWPQAVGSHENRLWLGGTNQLPDAAWGSVPFRERDFDTGDGGPSDALALYGIGEQAAVRNFLSNFDLIILTDKGEYYVPGSTEQAVTPETARTITATRHGASYAMPYFFDGSVFFLEKTGLTIRELNIRNADQGYYAIPASTVVSDWITRPKHVGKFSGAGDKVTPYLLFGSNDNYSLVVMHSSREDESFGFMRWTLNNARFHSAAGVDERLFAAAEKDGEFFLVEFDTSDDYITVDFGEALSGAASTSWASTYFVSQDLQMFSGKRNFADVTLDAGGNFTTSEALTDLVIGVKIRTKVEMNAPVAGSGQGPKAGKMTNLVSAEIHWKNTWTGYVGYSDETEISVLEAHEQPVAGEPETVNEWREYHVGEWDREPRLELRADTPGHFAMRAITLNVYF